MEMSDLIDDVANGTCNRRLRSRDLERHPSVTMAAIAAKVTFIVQSSNVLKFADSKRRCGYNSGHGAIVGISYCWNITCESDGRDDAN
jgi:hypothetical protein